MTYLTQPLANPATDALRETARKAALRERAAYRRFDASGKANVDLEKLEAVEAAAQAAFLAFRAAHLADVG